MAVVLARVMAYNKSLQRTQQCRAAELTVQTAVANDIAIALRSSFAERRRGLVKGIVGFAPRLLSRFVRGGT
jgi:hypothetical protein